MLNSISQKKKTYVDVWIWFFKLYISSLQSSSVNPQNSASVADSRSPISDASQFGSQVPVKGIIASPI